MKAVLDKELESACADESRHEPSVMLCAMFKLLGDKFGGIVAQQRSYESPRVICAALERYLEMYIPWACSRIGYKMSRSTVQDTSQNNNSKITQVSRIKTAF